MTQRAKMPMGRRPLLSPAARRSITNQLGASGPAAKTVFTYNSAGQVTGAGSLFWIHHTKRRLSDYRSARPDDPQASVRTFMGLVNEGVLLTQRGLGACSAAMTESDVDRFVEALGRVLEPVG